MAMNGQKLGELLMEADIITKRQLAKACQKQVAGDKRKLGEILVDLGYVTIEDLTEVVMEQANKAKADVEKSKKLFENAREPKTLYIIDSTGHYATLYDPDYISTIKDFILSNGEKE